MGRGLNEIRAEGFAVEIFSVGVDVNVGELVTLLSPLAQ